MWEYYIKMTLQIKCKFILYYSYVILMLYH